LVFGDFYLALVFSHILTKPSYSSRIFYSYKEGKGIPSLLIVGIGFIGLHMVEVLWTGDWFLVFDILTTGR